MAAVTLLQRDYSRGMKRDSSRDQLPAGSLWNLVDWIPNAIGAPIRKRGGFEYGSAAFGAGSYAAASAFADFSSGSQLVGINDGATLFSIDPTSGIVTSKGAAGIPLSHPFLHRNLLVIPSADGVAGVYSYDGAAAPAPIAASAPPGLYGDVYKDRTVLGNILGQEQRLFFGPGGSPSGIWDQTNSYIDASFPLRGVKAMRNLILLFGRGHTERIIGTTPPPNTDMERQPLFDIGCLDARSIVASGDNVIFANEQGIWLTDGSIPENLCKSAGMLSYWIDTLANYAPTWTLAAGLHRGAYVISIMNGANFIDAISLDLTDRTWFRISNLTARMFARAIGTSEELYFALRDEARIGSLSSLYNPTDAVRNDADGTPVLPVLESSFFKDAPTMKRWHHAYLDFMLSQPSTGAKLELAYITSPEATAYTVIGNYLAQETVDRKPLPLRFKARGLGIRIRQTAASADTRIHELEADVHALERSR